MTPTSQVRTPYPVVPLCIACGLLFMAVFYSVGVWFGEEGHVAVPHLDTLLFLQYGKTMAQGHPYEFTPGALPSTGSTSHLYMLLPAALWLAGAKGDALLTAGFVANVVLFLLFIPLGYALMRRIDRRAAPLALVLTVVNGRFLSGFATQTDLGLFIVLTTWAMLASLRRKPIQLTAALVLGAFCRPEGMIFPGLLFLLSLRRGSEVARRGGLVVPALFGILAGVAVMAVNHRLTGIFSFHSVIGKGLLRTHPPGGALFATLLEFSRTLPMVLFGLEFGGPRAWYAVPILGGAAGLLGLFSRDWLRGRTARVELWWLAAALSTSALSSTSGWYGVQFDRYLAWLIPVWMIYMSIGVLKLTEPARFRHARPTLILFFVVYHLGGVAYFASRFADGCASAMARAGFARSAAKLIPEGSSVGFNGSSGLMYFLPDRASVNISGITTAELSHKFPQESNVEILKHHPALRFDRWLVAAPRVEGSWYSVFIGDQLASEVPVFGQENALILTRADWSSLDPALRPLSPEVLAALEGYSLIDHLDVGYPDHEVSHDYDVFTRIPGAWLHPDVQTREIAGTKITETGRVIVGSQSFTLRTTPGYPVQLVLRLSSSATPVVWHPAEGMGGQDFNFVSPIRLRLFVEDEPAGDLRVNLDESPERFTELVLSIPATMVRSERTRITIGGDHVIQAIWSYQ